MLKRSHLMIVVLVLLGAVFCAPAVRAVDDPETAVNEADVVSVALLPSASVRLAPPAGSAIQNASVEFVSTADHRVRRSASLPPQRSQDSLQKLLCTFLI